MVVSRAVGQAGPLLLAALTFPGAAAAGDKADGYAEWRRGDVLVVDGQRVRMGRGGSLKGAGGAGSRPFAKRSEG